MKQRQEQARERRLNLADTKALEMAGDEATARWAYVEAQGLYEQAVAQGLLSRSQERNLCRKIGFSIRNGTRPERATSWFERSLQLYEPNDARTGAPGTWRYLAHQRWVEVRSGEIFESLTKAQNEFHLQDEDPEFSTRTRALHAYYLILLGRYNEATDYFSSGSKIRQDWTIGPAVCLNQRAISYAIKGEVDWAFHTFERAVEYSKGYLDGYYTATIWDDYATWASALGRLDLAQSNCERALLIARERRIGWRIPYLTLRLSEVSLKSGNIKRAHHLLLDALTYDTETPVLRLLRSAIALQLSHVLDDEEIRKRAVADDALELAFQSGEPRRIAPIVAEYVRLAIGQGNARLAKHLVARGLGAISQADHAEELLALSARYGFSADAQQAKHLLLARMQLPQCHLAEAFLDVWEAQAALKRRATLVARNHAQRAAAAFARLGWWSQHTRALALVGMAQNIDKHQPSSQDVTILGDLSPALTNRERQVADLVLKGLTNRVIAGALNISEHTVESHMTSILHRLGLRSRWQLIQLKRPPDSEL